MIVENAIKKWNDFVHTEQLKLGSFKTLWVLKYAVSFTQKQK
jgi:hypothetical protein